MADLITIRGFVGTEPNHLKTESGVELTSFRMGSTTRKIDPVTGVWIDSDSNWYSVVCFGNLAQNVAESIRKNERVLVTGQLKIKDWDNGEKSGRSVEIHAKALGHDLNFGTSQLERRSPATFEEDDEDVEIEEELQPA